MSATSRRARPAVSTESFEIIGGPESPVTGVDAKPPATVEWSFGPLREEIAIAKGALSALAAPSRSANENSDEADSNAPQRIDVPDLEPTQRPTLNTHGKRSMRALNQWEGIVEGFTPEGFVARLIPIEGGVPDHSRDEVTEFSWDELNIPNDADFVGKGTVFYWSVVVRTNEAGTQFRDTDLRLRRIPSVTSEQERRAAVEAAEIIEKFGTDVST